MWIKFKKYFISGLIFFLPFTLTIYLFILLVSFTDGFLGRYLQPYFYKQFGFYFRGVSILIGVCLITLIGFFITHFIGHRVYNYFERMLVRLPFFRQVYPAFKEMVIFLFSRDRLKTFKQVVLIEYPRKGLYAVGFLTNEHSRFSSEVTKHELCNVFVPSAPGPLTGYVVMVPKKELVFLDITIEQAFQLILSGGVVDL